MNSGPMPGSARPCVRVSPPSALAAAMACLIASVLTACTAEQLYATGQAYQRNQCGKILDKAEYDRCMSGTNTPYDDYKRETKPARD